MAWGQTRNKAYQADYNRSFNTHTSGTPEQDATVRDPSYADVGPVGYQNPTSAPDLQPYPQTGPTEIATGNAPSGGYSTLPGNGFSANLNEVMSHQSYRLTEDREAGQVIVAAVREATTEARKQTAQVHEDLATPKPVPGSQPVRAVTHSPYEHEWGEGGRLTTRINPNPWEYTRDWDNQGEVYRGSGARYLNGEHYSMAKHGSLNPFEGQTNGMAPVQTRRNTYRLDPSPWDEGLTDSPDNTPGYSMTQNLGANGPFPSNYRL